MEKTLTIQLKLPEEINKVLRINAINQDLTLKQYCIKVLTDHVRVKQLA